MQYRHISTILFEYSNPYICELLDGFLIMRIFAYICITMLIAAPALASAGEPLEDLRRGIDKGIRILEDPRYEDAALKEEQQEKLWEVNQDVSPKEVNGFKSKGWQGTKNMLRIAAK